MTTREPHPHARRAETRFRCRRCEIPYVVAGLYRRRRFRCRYCGDVLQVTEHVLPARADRFGWRPGELRLDSGPVPGAPERRRR